jgi:hypothetical protein
LKIAKTSRRERHSTSAGCGQTKTKEVKKTIGAKCLEKTKNNWGKKCLEKSEFFFGQRPKNKRIKKMSESSRATRLTLIDLEIEIIEAEMRC